MSTPSLVAAEPTLRLVDVPEADPRWNAFVRSAEGGTFCHLSPWQRIMREVLGHEPRYRAVVDEAGEWHGVLPLIRVRSRLLGHFLLSMPFLNDGGPLGSPAARALLTSAAVSDAARAGADLLELRTRDAGGTDLQVANRRISVHLPLPQSPEALWERCFDHKLRNKIRRARREGMETRFGPEQMPAFYEVFARNMRDLGTPVLPPQLFEAIRDRFAGEAIFAAVYLNGTPVAVGCGFLWQGEFEITWGSSLREFNHLRANMLLYAELMEEVIRRGGRLFNFGRCVPGSGTHAFKLQWGGHDVPLPWVQWSARGVAAPPTPDSPVFRAAVATWKRMPLPIANRLGPVLARRLP